MARQYEKREFKWLKWQYKMRKRGNKNTETKRISLIIHILWFNKTNQFSPLRLFLLLAYLRQYFGYYQSNGFGTAWGGDFFEKLPKLWVFNIYQRSKLFWKSPKHLSQNPSPLNCWKVYQMRWYSKNPPKQFWGGSPHSSPSCLPGKTFTFFLWYSSWYFIHSRLLLLTFTFVLLLLAPPKLCVSFSFSVLQ
jgi:hypothetical protein